AAAAAAAGLYKNSQEANDKIAKLENEYKPEPEASNVPANLATANILCDYLGKPAGQNPAKWAASLGLLGQDYDLLDLFRYAFQVNRKWGEKLRAAKHPVKYLESVLPHILEDYSSWSMKKQEKVKSYKPRCQEIDNDPLEGLTPPDQDNQTESVDIEEEE